MMSHCRVLPPGEVNGMIPEPLSFCSKNIVTMDVTILLKCCTIMNTVTDMITIVDVVIEIARHKTIDLWHCNNKYDYYVTNTDDHRQYLAHSAGLSKNSKAK